MWKFKKNVKILHFAKQGSKKISLNKKQNPAKKTGFYLNEFV